MLIVIVVKPTIIKGLVAARSRSIRRWSAEYSNLPTIAIPCFMKIWDKALSSTVHKIRGRNFAIATPNFEDRQPSADDAGGAAPPSSELLFGPLDGATAEGIAHSHAVWDLRGALVRRRLDAGINLLRGRFGSGRRRRGERQEATPARPHRQQCNVIHAAPLPLVHQRDHKPVGHSINGLPSLTVLGAVLFDG